MLALFLAGGSGTRLWPLSRQANPKQLHSLIGKNSLMTETIQRMSPLIHPSDTWIVTNECYATRIAEHSHGVPSAQIITEPFPLGTNLAVGLGLIHAERSRPDSTIAIGWADSYIGNEDKFRNALEDAEALLEQVDGVILGVRPDCVSTAYGYIELGERSAASCESYKIERFCEKPNYAKAQTFFDSDRHLWNTGITVWKVSRLLELIKEYKPNHYEALRKVSNAIGTADLREVVQEAFAGLDGEPIDTAVLEKAPNLAVIAVDLNWTDVGSWSALYDVQAKAAENITRGKVVAVDTDKCLIYAQNRLVATLGISDLIIVETDDAVMIARKNDAGRLKELYAEVKSYAGQDFL